MRTLFLTLLSVGCGSRVAPDGPIAVEPGDVTEFLEGTWRVVGPDAPTELKLQAGGVFALSVGEDGAVPFQALSATTGTWTASVDTLTVTVDGVSHAVPMVLLDGKLNVELGGVQFRRY